VIPVRLAGLKSCADLVLNKDRNPISAALNLLINHNEISFAVVIRHRVFDTLHLKRGTVLTSSFDEALKKVQIDAELLFEKKIDMDLLYCRSRAFIRLHCVPPSCILSTNA
jgi:hypothetical protein